MINLKKYIQQNLNAINDKEAPSGLWNKISKELDNDNLENFISKNKEAFSDKIPSESLWVNIDTSLSMPTDYKKDNSTSIPKSQKVVPISYLWRMAAAFAVVLVATIWFTLNVNQETNSNVIATNNTNLSFAEIAPELYEAEIYYESMISLKQNEVANYDLVALGLQHDFKYDLNLLDSAYTEIKKEILRGNTNEMLIKGIVDNLQLRMNILNQQLIILKSLQQNNKQDENRTIQL